MKPGDLVIVASSTAMWTHPFVRGRSRAATSNVVCRLERGQVGIILHPESRAEVRELVYKDDLCLFGDRYGYVARDFLTRLS